MKKTEVLVVGLARVLSALVALASFAVMTRLLPPQQYGLVALLTAFATFAGLIFINPSGQWLQRHLHEWFDSGCLASRLNAIVRYVLVSALLLGVAAGIWYGALIEKDVSQVTTAAAVVAFFVCFSTAAQTYAATLNALGRRVAGALWGVGAVALPLLAAIVAVSIQANALYWIGGQALGALLAYWGARRAMNAVLINGRSQRESDKANLPFFRDADYWRFALPLTAVTALMWAEGNGYRFVLERHWSADTLGIFLLALSVPAQMTAVLESFIFQYAYPYYFRNLAAAGDRTQQGESASAMASALLPLYWVWGGFLLLMAPQFIFALAGQRYHDAAQWAVFGCLMEVARLSGNAWSVAALAVKSYRPMVIPFAVGAVGSFVSAAATVAFDLSPAWLGWGLVMGAVLKALGVAFQSRRMLPVRVPTKRLVAGGGILGGGLILHTHATQNYGVWVALCVVGIAGTLAVLLGYAHLKTSRGFKQLVSVELASR